MFVNLSKDLISYGGATTHFVFYMYHISRPETNLNGRTPYAEE